jgi:AsmA-like C-terminal region
MGAGWSRAARAFALAAGALALGMIGLVLALPWFVDLPSVRVQLQQRLSAMAGGDVSWERLELRLLPTPRGVVEGVRLEIAPVLSVRAARVDARLNLWALLRGRAELTSLMADGPQIRLAPVRAEAPQASREAAPEPLAAYRALASSLARTLRAHAPATQVGIERGVFELQLPGRPSVQLRDLTLRARAGDTGVELDLAAASENWSRLHLAASVEYAGLASQATLSIEGLRAQSWADQLQQQAPLRIRIAPLGVQAGLRADAKGAFAGRVEAATSSLVIIRDAREFHLPGVALKANARGDAQNAALQIGELSIAGEKLFEGEVAVAYAGGDAQGSLNFDLDAARALALARRVLEEKGRGGIPDVQSATGRLRGRAQFARKDGQWRAGLQLRDTDASFQVRQLPWAVSVQAGSARWEQGTLGIAGIRGILGQSSLTELSGRLRWERKLRLVSAAGKARLELDQIYPWLKQNQVLAQALRDIPSVTGALDVELLKASGPLASLDYEFRLIPRRLQLRASALPGAVSLADGAVRLTPKAVSFDQVGLALLDAKATATGSVGGIGTGDLRVQTALADGVAGAQLVDWAMRQAKAPEQLALRAPLRFAAKQLSWGPGKRLEAAASVQFEDGPSVAVDLAWRPELLEVRRLEVHDPRGTGAMALRLRGRRVDGSFTGSIHGGVLAYLLKDPERYSGRIAGDLRFEADLDQLRYASVEGRLQGDGLDLAWLAGRPLVIERFGLEADRERMRLDEVALRSGEDSATLRGELRRSDGGPIVDLSLESPGIVLDRLLPPKEAGTPQESTIARGAREEGPAMAREEPRKWWPLPLTGRIAVRSDFLQYGHLRAAPLSLAVELQPDRARLEVREAQLCGISMPLAVEARDGTWSASAQLAAKKQPVAQMAACLTGDRVQITGEAEFAVALKTQGRADELLRNLEGTGRAEVRDGRIQKFALIGNVLSLLDIQDLPQTAQEAASGAQGFRFRKILAAGRFSGGQFTLDEGAFESPAAGMVANGTIRLSDYDTRMTVLVAPFGRVDRLVRGIPVIGYVIGGTLTSIPVGVSGDIRSPLVVPLGPRAITSELLGIFERTMKLPGKLAEPPVKQ